MTEKMLMSSREDIYMRLDDIDTINDVLQDLRGIAEVLDLQEAKGHDLSGMMHKVILRDIELLENMKNQ